jgi:hypothetical protein
MRRAITPFNFPHPINLGKARSRARSRQHRRPQTRPTPHGVQWYSADMPFGGTKQSGVGRQLTVIGMVTYYVG